MAGIIDLFVPKEKKFFQYIDKQIVLLQETSDLLGEIVADKKVNSSKLQHNISQIRKKSKEANDISIEIITLLHKTFITPIDREDIKLLSGQVCLITDSIKKIATSVLYLKVEKFDKYFMKQISILQESIKHMKFVFEVPLSTKRNKESLELIKNLEREADDIYREALGDTFSNGYSAIEIIKKKELYQCTEDAIDDVRTTIDQLETIIIVNS